MQTFYEEVTASIIAELEAGTAPWVKAWDSGSYLPHNAITHRRYSGINTLILLMRAQARGYPSAAWLTFKQALEAGAHVRKGEKATMVVFVKKLAIAEAEDKENHSITMLKRFFVFNAAQIEGLPKQELDPLVYPDVDEFTNKLGATIGVGEPCYIPSLDQVMMPPRSAFRDEAHYHATKLHELCHWTGAKHRLDRDLTGRFGDRSYAAEELVAELGGAFLCAQFGVKGDLRHAGYIGHWLQLLRDDAKAIFTASAKAQQAADYLQALGGIPKPTEAPA